MVEAINELIAAAMGSPWALPALFVVCLLDAFFPVVPSETTVIAGGALAAEGQGHVVVVMALAALGAFVGDHVSYAIGRGLGSRASARLLPGRRGQAALAWAGAALRERGGVMIVALRFVPGGRVATTLTAGTLEYPLRRFSGFAALAALLWALYSGLVGYFAGEVFAGNHLLAVTVGVGFSLAIGVGTEGVRFGLRQRRRGRAASAEQVLSSAASSPGSGEGRAW
ncbi:DedA family protein [Salinactinospora qingdaonensis]|uniref:VTT domain-containing protein n=1 Tax=Salinactinospora qingdaonensis TaxID=702744 RepID=A0ABP7G2Z5_9ACTN